MDLIPSRSLADRETISDIFLLSLFLYLSREKGGQMNSARIPTGRRAGAPTSQSSIIALGKGEGELYKGLESAFG